MRTGPTGFVSPTTRSAACNLHAGIVSDDTEVVGEGR